MRELYTVKEQKSGYVSVALIDLKYIPIQTME